MASAYPTDVDLMGLLYASNLIDSPSAPSGRSSYLDYSSAVAAAKAEFERRTNRTYAAAADSRDYDPPTDGANLLDLEGDWSSISGVTRQGDSLVEGDDYRLRPIEGPPYRFVEFIASQTAPVPWSMRGSLTVTGTRGSSNAVPDDVFAAVLQRAAAHLAPSLQGILTQGAQSVKQADAAISFAGGRALGALSEQWMATFERAIDDHGAAGLIF